MDEEAIQFLLRQVVNRFAQGGLDAHRAHGGKVNRLELFGTDQRTSTLIGGEVRRAIAGDQGKVHLGALTICVPPRAGRSALPSMRPRRRNAGVGPSTIVQSPPSTIGNSPPSMPSTASAASASLGDHAIALAFRTKISISGVGSFEGTTNRLARRAWMRSTRPEPRAGRASAPLRRSPGSAWRRLWPAHALPATAVVSVVLGLWRYGNGKGSFVDRASSG